MPNLSANLSGYGNINAVSVTTTGAVSAASLSVSGLAVLNGIAAFANKVAFSVITPAAISGNTDNWAGPGSATIVRASSTGAFNITGIPAGDGGEVRYLHNVGANNIVLTNEDVASSEGNRFLNGTGANITITPNDVVILIYDSTSLRWRASLVQ